jgi:hypothetical protein
VAFYAHATAASEASLIAPMIFLSIRSVVRQHRRSNVVRSTILTPHLSYKVRDADSQLLSVSEGGADVIVRWYAADLALRTHPHKNLNYGYRHLCILESGSAVYLY